MRHKNSEIRRYLGMTILEVVIALAIMTVIFTALLPLTKGIQNSWDSKKGSTEIIQNARVLTDHLTRNLTKAVKVIAVSDADEINGFIEFQDNDGNTMRYEIADNYIEFGPAGSLSQLAGPVSKLQFTCYKISDLDTPMTDISDVNSIRYVKAEAILTNPAAMAQDKTVTASAFIYTNANTLGPLSEEPNLVVHYAFEGNYINSVTGIAADPRGPTIAITSDPNHPERGQILGLYTSGYKKKGQSYEGDHVVCGNDDVADILNAITIAAWMKTNQQSNVPAFVSKGYAWRLNQVWSGPINTMDFDMASAALVPTSGGDPVGTIYVYDNQWHHIVGVYTGQIQSIYIDGQLNDSVTRTGTMDPWAQYVFWIGGQSNMLATFIGFIDDVRIYDGALCAADVLALYNNQEPEGCWDGNSLTAQILP